MRGRPMAAWGPVVFLLHEEKVVRDSLGCLFESDGLHVEAFGTPREFRRSYDSLRAGCLVFDVNVCGESGLDLYDEMCKSCIPHPFLIVTNSGDVPSAIRAFKLGAVDFIEKPIDDGQLLESVHKAIARDAEQRLRRQETDLVQARIDSLSPRERRVMWLVASGKMTKEIARELGIAVKTVEVHRSNLTRKMGVRSVVQLVNTLNRLGVGAQGSLDSLRGTRRDSSSGGASSVLPHGRSQRGTSNRRTESDC